MNFVYEPLQFDRLTKLVEFNTLLCIDTIKKELEEIVAMKKKFIQKNTFKKVVDAYRRVNCFNQHRARDGDLRLKVSLSDEMKMLGDSDGVFFDALENLPQ